MKKFPTRIPNVTGLLTFMMEPTTIFNLDALLLDERDDELRSEIDRMNHRDFDGRHATGFVIIHMGLVLEDPFQEFQFVSNESRSPTDQLVEVGIAVLLELLH